MMPQELLPLRPLLTSEERAQSSKVQAAAVFHLLFIFGLLVAGTFLLTAGLVGVCLLAAAVFFGIASLRQNFRRDTYYAKLHATVTERLQDEVFLRFQVVPTRPVVLGQEANFVTIDNETVRGMVMLDSGEPRFALIQHPTQTG